jgi:hypothetical protein
MAESSLAITLKKQLEGNRCDHRHSPEGKKKTASRPVDPFTVAVCCVCNTSIQVVDFVAANYRLGSFVPIRTFVVE